MTTTKWQARGSKLQRTVRRRGQAGSVEIHLATTSRHCACVRVFGCLQTSAICNEEMAAHLEPVPSPFHPGLKKKTYTHTKSVSFSLSLSLSL